MSYKGLYKNAEKSQLMLLPWYRLKSGANGLLLKFKFWEEWLSVGTEMKVQSEPTAKPIKPPRGECQKC